MSFKMLILAGLSALLVGPTVLMAAEPCCDGGACCQKMAACCNNEGDNVAASVLLPQMEQTTVVARQTSVVWFMKPVRVGDSILQGKYIIEHDNDRMARGLPCTHIYSADKPQTPVVKFHCTHLERPQADRDVVELVSTGDASVPAKLGAFQFAGESAAHGMPKGR